MRPNRNMGQREMTVVLFWMQIVVVEKASGLLSVPGVSATAKDCLINRVADFVPGVRVVHRLDRSARVCVCAELGVQRE